MRASVLVVGEFTEDFGVNTGVKQGFVIAPMLFSIFLTAVLHFVRKNMPAGIQLRFRFNDLFNLRRLKAKTTTTVCELQYADNNAIVTYSKEDLQHAMDAFNYAYTALGLKLNAKKAQVLYQSRTEISSHDLPKILIKADGEELACVHTFNYFKSFLSSKANINAEMDRRLQAACMALKKLRTRVNNKDINKHKELMVYKAFVLPTLLYESEAWVTYSHNLKTF